MSLTKIRTHESVTGCNPIVIDLLGYFRRHIGDSQRLRQTHVFESIMSASAASQDDWIRVTSNDGFSFIVKRSVVFRSGTLRNMLDERRTLFLHAPPPNPIAQLTGTRHDTLDSFAEAVQKVCPVDERLLPNFFFQKIPSRRPFFNFNFSVYPTELP